MGIDQKRGVPGGTSSPAAGGAMRAMRDDGDTRTAEMDKCYARKEMLNLDPPLARLSLGKMGKAHVSSKLKILAFLINQMDAKSLRDREWTQEVLRRSWKVIPLFFRRTLSR